MRRAIEVALAVAIIILATIAGAAPTVPPPPHPLPVRHSTPTDDLIYPAGPDQ